MKILFTPNLKNNTINFGNSSPAFKKEYDEFILKTADNRKISKISLFDFNKKADTIVEAFKDAGVTKKAYLKCILQYPMLCMLNPETIINNVNRVLEAFKDEQLTKDAYLKAAMKQPQIMALSPERIENNIRGLAKLYREHGLSDTDYLTMALKHPSLFSQTPQRISQNIETVVQRYHESGLETKDFIRVIKKFPSVTSLSPQTIINNIDSIVQKYSKYGLTEEKYIEMLKLAPIGFNINAANKINNITKLVKTLEPLGMTEEKCIKTFLRQKVIIFSNMDSLAERIKFLTFTESEKLLDCGIHTKNPKQNLDNGLMKNLSYSQETNYMLMLRDKLKTFCNQQITYRHLKNNVEEFIKQNPNSIFEFKISNSEYTKDFINFIETLSTNLVGKNIFKIVLR